MRRLASILLLLVLAAPAAASDTGSLIPPVDAPVALVFDPPDGAYGPGHRGVDFRVSPGTPVRAAGPGTVTFAGSVGSLRAVTVAHAAGLETTYSSLGEVEVRRGQEVDTGTVVGLTDVSHPDGERGLHLGVRLHGAYVDPLLHLSHQDHGSAFALAPLVPDGLEESLAAYGIEGLGSLTGGCSSRSRLDRAPVAPNDNVLVLVAGIGSRTAGGVTSELYASAAAELGYDPERTYRFSYKGVDGPRFHIPYEAGDTSGDIRVSAERLKELMLAIADEHPGAKVDVIAHSQGGVVARTFLQAVAPRSQGLPRVEHLVTLSSPHSGAPLAGASQEMAGSVGGRLVRRVVSEWARRGGPLPDPDAVAVSQLAPGSSLLRRLSESVMPFGTRALSLAIPNDVVVPADRAHMPGGARAVVPPGGLSGHDRIVTSSAARGLIYRFLAGGTQPCGSGWDGIGSLVGKAISGIEGLLPRLVGLGAFRL